MQIADRCRLKWKWLSISIHPTLSRFKRNAVDYQALRITFTFTSTCYNGSKFTKIYDMHGNFHDSMILWQLSKACWMGLPNKISRFFSRIAIFNFVPETNLWLFFRMVVISWIPLAHGRKQNTTAKKKKQDWKCRPGKTKAKVNSFSTSCSISNLKCL